MTRQEFIDTFGEDPVDMFGNEWEKVIRQSEIKNILQTKNYKQKNNTMTSAQDKDYYAKNPLAPDPNNGLTFAQEVMLTIRRDGILIAVEEQNGHITRHKTIECTKTDSLEILGADKMRI